MQHSHPSVTYSVTHTWFICTLCVHILIIERMYRWITRYETPTNILLVFDLSTYLSQLIIPVISKYQVSVSKYQIVYQWISSYLSAWQVTCQWIAGYMSVNGRLHVSEWRVTCHFLRVTHSAYLSVYNGLLVSAWQVTWQCIAGYMSVYSRYCSMHKRLFVSNVKLPVSLLPC